MPRNGSGTYTLPAGNPVEPSTTIEADWANGTLDDVANEITNSLSRNGEGGMLAPFRLSDGSLGAPGLSYTLDTSTGLYRAGSGQFWAVATAARVMQWTTSGTMIPSGKTLTVNGNAAFSTVQIGGLVSGSTASFTGTVQVGALTSTGTLTFTTVQIGTLTATTLGVTGNSTFSTAQVGTLSATTMSVGSLTMTGNAALLTTQVGTLSATTMSVGSLTMTGNAALLTTQVGGLATLSLGANLSGASSPLQVQGSAGTSGYVLTSAGAGATPTWSPVTAITTITIGTLTATTLAVSGNSSLSTTQVGGLLTASLGVNLSGASSPLQVGGSAGTSGQLLTSAGAGATPTWTTVTSSTPATGYTFTDKTTTYSAAAGDVIRATTSAFTITLPSMTAGQYVIVARDQTAGVTTIGRNSQTIDGVSADFTIDLNKVIVMFLCTGTGAVVTRFIGVLPT